MCVLRVVLALPLALVCALAPPVSAASPGGGVLARPGPDVLYAPAVDAPQLQNTGIWRAPPILVSGATAYRDGEFLYQDFLYDDLGAGDAYRYPGDPRYAANAADIVEVRIKPVDGGMAIRLTFNSMIDPALVATTIALGERGGPHPVPHGANARMPAEVFVTVHGAQADAVDAGSGRTLAPALPVAVDVPRRQVEVRVPTAVFAPPGDGVVRLAAASGLWDAAANAYAAQSGAAFFNVAFRTGEPPSAWRTSSQAGALASGDLSAFYALVDFARLRAGDHDDSGVPATGFMDRMMASGVEDRQGRGEPVSRKPGCAPPCALQYSGRLQPYALYVPDRPMPAGGYGLTIDLHGCGQTHNIGFASRRQRQLAHRATPNLVLTPQARGDCYWYYGQAAADVFEAWADVARRHPLDPSRTTIVGSSMGGYGALKLAAAYPDLFARAGAVAPCPSAGVASSDLRSLPGGRARSIAPLLPALRHVPVMTWQTTDDAPCRYAAQAAMVDRLHALGYAYAALTFSGIDHVGLTNAALIDAQPLAEFLGDARAVRDPPRVTYVASPTASEPEHGLRADHAYWLSDVRVARADRRGKVDLTSDGFGRRGRRAPGGTAAAGTLSTGLSYALVARSGAEPRRAAAEPRLHGSARNVRSVTVAAARARTGCRPSVDIVTFELLEVRLAGCTTTYAVKHVCQATPVFDVVVRAPRDERLRSRRVSVRGRVVPVRHGRVRLDLRRYPDALARVRVASVDRRGRTRIRATAHRWCS